MATLTQETVRYLANLAKIACTEEEEQSLLIDLKKILAYMEQLEEVPTDGVEPMAYVIEGDVKTPFREDVVVPTISTEDFLKNAPQQVAQMIKVPKVMKA